MAAGRWIKLYDVFLSSGNFGSDAERMIAIRLLLMAAFRPKDVQVGKETVHLSPGDAAVSIRRLSGQSGVPRNTLTRWITKFEGFGFIEILSRSPCLVVRIKNWSRYQGETGPPDLRVVGGADQAPAVKSNDKMTQGEIVQAMVDIFHEECEGVLGRIIKITDPRRRHLLARYKDEMQGRLDNWRAYCKQVARSKFLTGRAGGDRNWKADLDWIIKPANCVRILEGRYNKPGEEVSAAPLSAYDRAYLDWHKGGREGPPPSREDFEDSQQQGAARPT